MITSTEYRGAVDELLAWVVSDTTPCDYDHHGYCQTHFLHDAPCPWETIRAYVSEQT